MTYTYDALHRLKTAVTTGSVGYAQWGLSWTYDRYGNRTDQNADAGSPPPPQNHVIVSQTTNRITDSGYSYDLNGNLTADGRNALAYDAENRLVSNAYQGNTTGYAYDGAGLRMKKCAPNCTSPTSTTVYVFSGSKVIAEYDNGAAPASPTREYIYSGGALIATHQGSSLKFQMSDHLSARVITDSTGTVLEQRGHYPFGENWYEGDPNNKFKFTSYERDTESLNDFAMARYHVNRLGRFNSPDPLAGSIADPQSLNRYAYVLNDPCSLTDPLGFKPGCMINVYVGDLGPGVFDRISRLFAQAGVGVNFNTTPGSADYTLTFIDTNELAGKPNVRIFYGALGQSQGNYGWVFVNKTVVALIVEGNGSVDPSIAFAGIGAHEIMHGLGLPDVSGHNLMGPGTHVNPKDQVLTQGQKNTLLSNCQNLPSHRNPTKAGAGSEGLGSPDDSWFRYSGDLAAAYFLAQWAQQAAANALARVWIYEVTSRIVTKPKKVN